MNKNKGVTLVNMMIIVVVIIIISTVSIIGGVRIIENSRDTQNQENLATIQAIVNRIHLKEATGGVFTPASSLKYGKSASEILSGESEQLKDWYVLDEEDLGKMGIEYFGERYLVNYKANMVVTMEFYESNGIPETGSIVKESSNSIGAKVKAGLIKVGDFVKYEPDFTNTYQLTYEKTGYEDDHSITPENVSWRVWSIGSDGSLTIIPVRAVNALGLDGAEGLVNSQDVIESVCALYTNLKYDVTKDDIRSMKIEDVEDINISENLAQIRDSYNSSSYGKTNLDLWGSKAGYVGYTKSTHKIYMAEDGVTILKTPRIPTVENPVILTNTHYFANNIKWCSIDNNKFATLNYGILIGEYYSWLTSPFSNLSVESAYLGLKTINRSIMGCSELYDTSYGACYSEYVCGVRPLIKLKSTLELDLTDEAKNGSSSANAWVLKK